MKNFQYFASNLDIIEDELDIMWNRVKEAESGNLIPFKENIKIYTEFDKLFLVYLINVKKALL